MSDRPTPAEEKPHEVSLVEQPPTTLGGILLRLGPGLIVAGSIVGSGELIATTATGAQAGFWLLWLILIGCVIKVFVQVELGRYTLVDGRTTMDGLTEVPGPRIPGRCNWLVWYWFAMFLASMAQLGGIVGGVGQALAISAPLTAEGRLYNHYIESETQLIVHRAELNLNKSRLAKGEGSSAQKITELHKKIFDRELQSSEYLLEVKNGELEKVQKKLAGNKDDELQKQQKRLQDEIAQVTALRDLLAAKKDKAVETAVLLAEIHPLVDTVISNTKVVEELQEELESASEKKAAKLKEKIDKLTAESDKARAILSKLAAEHQEFDLIKAYQSTKETAKPANPIDDKIWATIITLLTAAVLFYGRYGLIQSFSTTLVALFTLITIVNLTMLQGTLEWSVSLTDIIHGMSFKLQGPDAKVSGLNTALATFGIIGVGASELITYPYWCMEKGYARFTGPKDDSPQWAERARGWMRVMRWDAWCSMVVYTFATIAFYLLGAAILGRTGLDPKGTEMIRYLSVMYQPVFGDIAQLLFLFGAFAVLYSTFFVANASQARVLADALGVMKLAPRDQESYRRRVRVLSAFLPFLCLSFFVSGWDPVTLVLFSGVMQAVMLPMLAGAALFFRYYRGDSRINPGRLWDIFLWISALGMLVAGAWAGWSKLSKLFFD